MEKYFDAFLYLANWGTHELMLRLPRRTLDLETARRYLKGESASARAKGDLVVLTFLSESEDGDGRGDDESGWLSSLIPIRADVAAGDLRALYLAWLLCAQVHELDEDALEPPVPARLHQLTAPLRAFVDFLRIDEELIAAAAERSSATAEDGTSHRDLECWVANPSESEKNNFLVQLATGDESQPRAALLRRFRKSRLKSSPEAARPRTVAELLAAAERRSDERHRKEGARGACEKVRREREEATARERYLDDLAKREPVTWQRIGSLIATKKPADYDEAVRLLRDLTDLGGRSGRAAEVQSRIQRIRDEHAKRPSLLRRLQRAGLIATATR